MHHGEPIRALGRLTGGFWSAAYGYRCGDDDLVARFGQQRDWFETDRAAMAYSSPDLPVPEVLDVGDAFDGVYAISRRHYGRFLEDVRPDEAALAAPMLGRLLTALRDAPAADGPSWRQWLVNSLEEDPSSPTVGWRAKLAAHREADRVFEAAVARVRELAAGCPERRDLLHGDLLHKNVLVSEDASSVNAVFSWKCSVRGDHLFDVAWCTFWGSIFHPGIAALDLAADLDDDERERHHCYELHIGASHLGWSAWTDDVDSLERILGAVSGLLRR